MPHRRQRHPSQSVKSDPNKKVGKHVVTCSKPTLYLLPLSVPKDVSGYIKDNLRSRLFVGYLQRRRVTPPVLQIHDRWKGMLCEQGCEGAFPWLEIGKLTHNVSLAGNLACKSFNRSGHLVDFTSR